ncbi:MAG: hypothetical protein HOI58_08335 [Kordiimonadaceae bacterium]|nr:hypothetical protein [Kordiimonadaceae bacterium]
MSFYNRALVVVLGLLAILFGPFLILYSGVSFHANKDEDMVPDPTLIEFTLSGTGQDTIFEIPHYYFEYEPYAENVKEFTLEMRLPNLTPESVVKYEAKRNGIPEEEQNEAYVQSYLRVVVSASKNNMVYKRLESSILPEEVRETKSFEEVFDLYYLGTKMHDISGNGILSKVGVAYGKDKQDKIYELNNPVLEFYVQRTFHDDVGFYIRCSLLQKIKFCDLEKDFMTEDLKIQIRFFNQNLKNWKILDKKINDFLKRHMKIKLGNR